VNQEKAGEFTYRLARRLYRHAQRSPEEIFRSLRSSAEGLSLRQVQERRQLYGPNEVAGKQRVKSLEFLLKAFRNPFNYLICTLAAVSYLTDDLRAALVMATMVALSVVLTFIQDLRSGRAAERLSAMVRTHVTVIRGEEAGVFADEGGRKGKRGQEVLLEELVPGEVILLSAGDLVPADVRLVTAKTLMVNQSAITGESMPVEKDAYPDADSSSKQLSELRNICFMGSSISSGAAMAIVLHTGQRTCLGSIAKSILSTRVETDFDRGIHRFTRLMLQFMLVMVPLVFLVNGFTKGNWSEAFLFAIAVAVGLTPEMLPMIVTVNLAKGAMAMSKKKVIVKRLNAIQNFGAMDVLCTDKTGTLTEDLLVFGGAFDVMGNPDEEVLKYAYLNSLFQTGLKNFLDLALIQYAEKQLAEYPSRFRLIDELPFDFVRKRMSVLVETQDRKRTLICKGATEEVFSRCSYAYKDGVTQLITPSDREAHLSVFKELADQGYRALAVAYRDFPSSQTACELRDEQDDEQDLVLLGFVGFLDPPIKEHAALAIQALARFGVTVKILTGDNERVTAHVAMAVGLNTARVLLGHEIATMSDPELRIAAEATTVFAKLTPDQKRRIIRALQDAGHVVGFMGDGINDAPALRAADVGISVNNAVDIAKESADIILLEKNLLVLEQGVIEGRKVFGNIIKYIKMGASSNFGNVFSMLGASCLLPFLPMMPVQMLTQNLLYDFSQAAIPLDRVDEEYLKKPRKWEIGDIRKFMFFFGPVSSIFDYATFAIMWFFYKADHVGAQSLFQSGWFVEGLLSQTLIVHLIRTRQIPFIQSRASGALLLTTALVMAAGLYLPFSHYGQALGFVPLPLSYFAWLTGVLTLYCVLAHGVKTWFIGRYGYQ
jgi:P-type Mg2+ transporter